MTKNTEPKKFTINLREDGRIDVVCEHGIGHTVKSEYNDLRYGCDRCCESAAFKKYVKEHRKELK